MQHTPQKDTMMDMKIRTINVALRLSNDVVVMVCDVWQDA